MKVLDNLLSQQAGIVTSFIVADDQEIKSTITTSIFTTIRKIIGNTIYQRPVNPTYFELICLLNFCIISDKSELAMSEETTLEDIGLDSIAVAETKNILEQKCNVFLNAKEILKLKVLDLWDMEKKCTVSGMSLFLQ